MVPEDEILAAPVIEIPASNSIVRNGNINVSGTTSAQETIIARLYTFSGSTAISQAQATRAGNLWAAQLSGTFAPGAYRIEVSQAGTATSHVTLRVTPVAITSPASGEVPTRVFAVTGTGGEYGIGVITVHNATGDAIVGTGVIASNGSWTASVTMPGNTESLSFYAIQKIGTHPSAKSNQVTVQLAVAIPRITSPSSGDIPDKQFRVSGTGAVAGGVITVYNASNSVLGPATVGTGGNWTADITLPSDTLPLTFYAKQKVGERDSLKSNEVTVKLADLAVPVIDSPQSGSTHPAAFELTGSQGTAGGVVEVLVDLSENVVGKSGTIASSSWTGQVNVQPGPVSLVARAVKDGRKSSYSGARAYKIRPPTLRDITDTHTDTSIKFSGTGHNGATVEIYQVSGPAVTMPPPVPVTKDNWEATAYNWPFGIYELNGIQKVPDNAGGWITSEPCLFTVDNVLPDVSDLDYTEQYQPTFSGKGSNGATVQVRHPNSSQLAAPAQTVVQGEWLTQASEVWGPSWEREVHIKQFMGTQQSPNWLVLKVTIAPSPPGLNEPEADGLSPTFSGTCWPGAVVTLVYDDEPLAEHELPCPTGIWQFKRTTPFAPDKEHKVTVTQFVDPQTSDPVSRTFTVSLPMRPPRISHPVADAKVGSDLVVTGADGMKGAIVHLRDKQFDRVLGETAPLSADDGWSIALQGLDYRHYTLDAWQTLGERPSEYSADVKFQVVSLPPEITQPTRGGTLERAAKFKGKGMKGGRVDIFLNDLVAPVLSNIPVDANGDWEGLVSLSVGRKTLWARQTVMDENGKPQESENSVAFDFDVVPRPPVIETPVADECVGIKVVVSGFGEPGDTVTVTLVGDGSSTPVSGHVQPGRTWSVTLDAHSLVGTQYRLEAVASSGEFYSSKSLRDVELAGFVPVIDQPAAGKQVSQPVEFAGQGRDGVGKVVSWYNPDMHWVKQLPVASGLWRGESLALPEGGSWCRFRQSLTNSADGATTSDWADSKRFEVEPAPAPAQEGLVAAPDGRS